MEHDTSDSRGFIARTWTDYRRRIILIALVAAAALTTVIALGFSPQLLAANAPAEPGSSTDTLAPQVTAPADPSPSSDWTTPDAASPAPPSAEPSADALADQSGAQNPAAASTPDAAAPRHLSYPDAGLNMTVLPLTPSQSAMASQSLVPPLTEEAYWITAYGKPGEDSQNTTYITGHSWEDRPAPFNKLSSQAEVGDTISVTTDAGELAYVVESVTTHDKNTLKNSDIWDIVPNRLVLISCYTEDLWGKNVVVTASPAPSS